MKQSEEWKQIYEIIKQLPIKNESGCNAMDAINATTEIEALFKKLLSLQNVNVSLPDFLYENEGEIRVGVHADDSVTDEWNKWKAGL